MKQGRLYLHSNALPMLQNLAAAEEEWEETSGVLANALSAKVFDCRGLPLSFLKDTGEAALEEWRETKQVVRLPFGQCWLELPGGGGVLAWEEGFCHGGIESTRAEFILFDGEHEPSFQDDMGVRRAWSRGCFKNDVPDPEHNPPAANSSEPLGYFHCINTDNPATEVGLQWGAEYLIGMLALMRDQLLAVEVRPDADARLNKARAKLGRLPLSAETRVLTLNLAAVRKLAKPAEGTHESPRLHWRRGHWRVIHRGKPIERRAWVKRCLVGDVDKGWVHKDYRMVWRPPMIEAA